MDLPPEIPVYERVYIVIRHIPAGQVATYGQIANLVDGCTARMVGYALAALDPHSNVPWQRVINSQGKISLRSGGIGSALQRQILEAEGVVFDEKGRVDFKKFGWPGIDTE
ncbi:MAG: MGMT family protein [Anaerolineae bacterium]|nr:MGMT family protein [Anaerolineae bacterium]